MGRMGRMPVLDLELDLLARWAVNHQLLPLLRPLELITVQLQPPSPILWRFLLPVSAWVG